MKNGIEMPDNNNVKQIVYNTMLIMFGKQV